MVILLYVISAMSHSHLGNYLVGMSSGLAVDAGSRLGVHLGMSTGVTWPLDVAWASHSMEAGFQNRTS